jgi:hypothetical protein
VNLRLPLISEPPTSEILRKRVLTLLAAQNGKANGKVTTK